MKHFEPFFLSVWQPREDKPAGMAQTEFVVSSFFCSPFKRSMSVMSSILNSRLEPSLTVADAIKLISPT